jgi:hypothetical protein
MLRLSLAVIIRVSSYCGINIPEILAETAPARHSKSVVSGVVCTERFSCEGRCPGLPLAWGGRKALEKEAGSASGKIRENSVIEAPPRNGAFGADHAGAEPSLNRSLHWQGRQPPDVTRHFREWAFSLLDTHLAGPMNVLGSESNHKSDDLGRSAPLSTWTLFESGFRIK